MLTIIENLVLEAVQRLNYTHYDKKNFLLRNMV